MLTFSVFQLTLFGECVCVNCTEHEGENDA